MVPTGRAGDLSSGKIYIVFTKVMALYLGQLQGTLMWLGSLMKKIRQLYHIPNGKISINAWITALYLYKEHWEYLDMEQQGDEIQ